MRRVAFVSVARSDMSIISPVLLAASAHEELEPLLIVAAGPIRDRGPAASAATGEIPSVAVCVEQADDAPLSVARSMGALTASIAEALVSLAPDMVVLTGDRTETHAAAVAAVPLLLPIAHLHGGEVTRGAIDDVLRNSITKLAHLHFVSAQPHADRVMAMGEDPWRITVSGAPGLDGLRSRADAIDSLREATGFGPGDGFLLVTVHPETMRAESVSQIRSLLEVLEATSRPVLFTGTNTDTGGEVIREGIERYVRAHPDARLRETLGPDLYPTAMRTAAAVVGNSSSGVIEAASLGAPVLDIGIRQEGRLRGRNVVWSGWDPAAMKEGLGRVLDPAFRISLAGMENPYGDGYASDRIVARLAAEPLGERLMMKTAPGSST